MDPVVVRQLTKTYPIYNSNEYKPYLESRRRSSTGEFVLVAGEDINGIAQMQAADPAECRSVARQRAISTPRDDRLKASDPDD